MRFIQAIYILNQFEALGLSEPILKAIKELGFDTPSEIQQKAIPTLLEGTRDFVGLAQTGTGKTAAFGLPTLELIDPDESHIQALILLPTRELCMQVADQLAHFSKYKEGIHAVAVYGGAPIERQIKALRTPTHVVIATPGRLRDLMRRKVVFLDQLEYLILDEADEMLNMGFKEELDDILTQAPMERITWLFSATMSSEVKAIAKKYMFDPVEVRINPKQSTNVNITHQYVSVRRSNKTEALVRFLDVDPELRGIVFCRTRRETQELAEKLGRRKYRADALHGDLSQAQRDRVMKKFRQEQLQVLVATDIAARGIDVNELTHVFHYSLPDENAYYTHRSGRTGRAGKQGISLALVDERDASKIKRIEKELKLKFDKVDIPSTEDIIQYRAQKWCEQILNYTETKTTDSELLAKANALFANLSKEELIARLLSRELDFITSQEDKDLNHTHDEHGSGRNEGRRRGRGKRRGRGRSSRRSKKNDSKSGRPKSHRKGNKRK